MKKKQIPKKNYIILTVIVIVTIALTFFCRNWYIDYKNSTTKISVMANFLVVLNEEELENYLLENQNTIIYYADSKNDENNEFEEELKKLVSKIGIENQMAFLDYKKISQKDLKKFKEKYLSEDIKDFGQYTNIFIIENGKIIKILYEEKTEIKIDDVKELFMSRGIMAQA